MASPEQQPQVTYAPLVPGAVDITSKVIRVFLQLAFSAGYYTVGGVAAGLAAYVSALAIDSTQFLWQDIKSEEPVSTSLGIGGYSYKYNPLNDTIQIFDGPIQPSNELTASQVIPAGVLNDVIVGQFTYNRI